MKHNLTIYSSICRLFTVAFVYVLIFATVFVIYRGEMPQTIYLIGIPVILLYHMLVQRYCYHAIPYILLHGIVYAPVLLISYPDKCYLYLYIMLLIVEDIHAFDIWYLNVERPYNEAPWHLFFFVTILYIASIGFHQERLSTWVYYIGVALLVLHFIRYFLGGIGNLFSQAEHATTMPTKRIMLTNTILFVMLMIFFVLLALFARLFQLDNFLYNIGDFLVKLIQWIIQAIIYIIGAFRLLLARNTVDSEVEDDLSSSVLPPAFQGEPSLIAQIITDIIEIAVAAFFIYITYKLIFTLIRLFLNRYAIDSDTIVTLTDKEETYTPKPTGDTLLSKLKRFFDNSNGAKVRRAYRLKIKSYKEAFYKKQDTPMEIADKVQENYQEDIHELTEIYEKARYSNEEVTYEDVEKGGIL